MKIVFASTQDQEEMIHELISSFYSDIFPLYFCDEDIEQFESIKVLHSTENNECLGTLKDAYHVISSLQTLILILRSIEQQPHYRDLFVNNAKNIQEYGLYFPFEYDHFLQAKALKMDVFSIYTKATNELLV